MKENIIGFLAFCIPQNLVSSDIGKMKSKICDKISIVVIQILAKVIFFVFLQELCLPVLILEM